MLWAITRVSVPNKEKERETYVQSHRDYLKSQHKILVLGGARLSDDGETQLGSLLIVNVASRGAAQAFLDADPLMKCGVFTVSDIARIRKGHFNPGAADRA